MSIGRTITDKGTVQTMQSFCPGDSLYVFVEGKQLTGEGGPRDLVMLQLEVARHLMGQIAMLCFASPQEAAGYMEPYFEFQKEKEAGIQAILDTVPVNLPPEAPADDKS